MTYDVAAADDYYVSGAHMKRLRSMYLDVARSILTPPLWYLPKGESRSRLSILLEFYDDRITMIARHMKQQLPFLWGLPLREVMRQYRLLSRCLDRENPKK